MMFNYSSRQSWLGILIASTISCPAYGIDTSMRCSTADTPVADTICANPDLSKLDIQFNQTDDENNDLAQIMPKEIPPAWHSVLGTFSSTVGFDFKIIHPQPGWKPMLDLVQSDDTARVPNCFSPESINSLYAGLMQVVTQTPMAQNVLPIGAAPTYPLIKTIYVHDSISGDSPICSATVGWTGPAAPYTATSNWEWQDYAENGQAMIIASAEN